MIKGIAYLGIAVRDIEQAREDFTQKLGSEIIRVGASEIDKVKNTYLTLGEDVFELMEPYSPESPVARFIEKRGEGVQYVGIEVTGLDETVAELRGKGVKFTSEEPVRYPNGSRWAFIHPQGDARGAVRPNREPGVENLSIPHILLDYQDRYPRLVHDVLAHAPQHEPR